MIARRPQVLAYAFAMACVLAGCGGLQSKQQSAQVYVLRAADVTETRAPLAASIQVLRPIAAPGLDSDRIMVLRADRRLDGFVASRWAASLPDVVESLAVDTLRASGAFRLVHDDRAPFVSDYTLRISIRDFEAEYSRDGAPPRVRVTLDCTIARRGERLVIASFVAQTAQAAEENRLGAVVATFESAAQAALATVIDQATTAVSDDLAHRP